MSETQISNCMDGIGQSCRKGRSYQPLIPHRLLCSKSMCDRETEFKHRCKICMRIGSPKARLEGPGGSAPGLASAVGIPQTLGHLVFITASFFEVVKRSRLDSDQ
jgi:hypothetical protein